MNKANPYPYAMRGGLIIGILYAMSFLFAASGISVLSALTYLISVIAIVLAYRFTRAYREKDCNGIISFGQVFWFILLLFFFAGVVSAVVKLFYLRFINPDFLETTFNQAMTVLEQMKVEIHEESIDLLHQLMQPTEYVMQSLMGDVLTGCFWGLVFAPFIRRNPQDQQNN